MGLAEKRPKAALGACKGPKMAKKRSQNDLFYAMIKISGIMNFFLPNLLVPKNVGSVKCKRKGTVKKYDPEHEPK